MEFKKRNKNLKISSVKKKKSDNLIDALSKSDSGFEFKGVAGQK